MPALRYSTTTASISTSPPALTPGSPPAGWIWPGKTGHLFLVEAAPVAGRFGDNALTLHQFDLEKRKVEKILEGINTFDLSHNGEKMLYRQQDKWHIAAAGSPPKPGEGVLKTDDMEVYVEPRAEWKQMYHEVWRIQGDFLYDPGHHGMDL